MTNRSKAEQTERFAGMLAAMGAAPRLAIVRLLLAAHPDGLFAGEIAQDLEIPDSTLSHHLDKLRGQGLVSVRREGTFLRYSTDTAVLQRLLGFLFAECCTRNRVLEPASIMCCHSPEKRS